jgi:hypothetical protein
MRDGILGQKWRLQPDFSPDPFALAMRGVECMIATAAATKLRTEVGALDLIKLVEFSPGFVANRTGDINF